MKKIFLVLFMLTNALLFAEWNYLENMGKKILDNGVNDEVFFSVFMTSPTNEWVSVGIPENIKAVKSISFKIDNNEPITFYSDEFSFDGSVIEIKRKGKHMPKYDLMLGWSSGMSSKKMTIIFTTNKGDIKKTISLVGFGKNYYKF